MLPLVGSHNVLHPAIGPPGVMQQNRPLGYAVHILSGLVPGGLHTAQEAVGLAGKMRRGHRMGHAAAACHVVLKVSE